MKIDLSGKRALVTGGSSGIGEGISRVLASAGARVAVNCSRHVDDAKRIAGELTQGSFAVQADVSDPGAVGNMFAEIDRAWQGLDLLVNCAGIDGKRALAWEAADDDWRRVIDINLCGAFYCAREALRRMVARRQGVIVNISSVHQEIAWSGYSAYACSKAAVNMLSQTLAQEAAPFGIRVVTVAPGAIKTPINASVWKDPAGLKDLLAKIPLGRLGEPADIANMVAFLASDLASYVTARPIFVDGGMTDYPDFSHGG